VVPDRYRTKAHATRLKSEAKLGYLWGPVVVSDAVSEFLRSYLTVVWFGLAAFLVAGLLLGISALVRPNKPNREKMLTYESGVDPVGDGWSQSQIRYYVFALLFVIFDVEAVFIFPWATQLERYAGFGLVEMGIFVAILLLGLVYAWRKGVLRWV
jgi:NADH-quinone oxidoreductase subunit A